MGKLAHTLCVLTNLTQAHHAGRGARRAGRAGAAVAEGKTLARPDSAEPLFQIGRGAFHSHGVDAHAL